MNDRVKEIIKTVLIFLGFIIMPSVMYALVSFFGVKDEVVLTFLSEVLYLGIVVLIYKDTLLKDINKFDKKYFKTMIKWWLIGIVIMVSSNAIINFVIFGGEIAANEEANREILTTYPVLGLLLAGLAAPLLEELTFRRGFRHISKNKNLFIFISTFVFAFLHVLTGLIVSTDPLKIDALQLLYLIPYGALGVSFGVIYAKTDNIYASFLTHAFHNTLTILLVFAVYGI